ncbi:zinc finger protein 568 isoform X6 [Amyelois transitella]|uniref:zinc finger protein 568 isoform X6 n=1 Tax=Amyelois transitella TaxID=680683 RepID=UPI00299052B0|nr:zinc finger protein 568 isoform X6 [Amyelois transitella]
MDSRINNGICRCCASEGTFKDLATTYHWMGEEEIYAEMLKECFDIQLSAAEDSEQGGICEVCITQLRNASNFKKQVLHTEKQFKKRLQDKLFKSSIVKVEVPGPDDDALESDNDNNDDFSGTEYDVPIKEEEPADEPKPRKRAARATTSRAKKSKTERGETSTKRGRRVKKERDRFQNEVKEGEIRSPFKETLSEKKAKREELKKHHMNLKMILQFSNATPIRCYGGLGYSCFFCDQQFPKPADLKKHTDGTHSTVHNLQFKKRGLGDYFVKLDITALRCKLCQQNVEDIKTLMDHLNSVHDKKIYMNLKDYILAFKFDTEELKCHVCSNMFTKFKKLQEHMNAHYRNFVCDICDAGFVNERHLLTHKECHILGTFNCSFCDKVYDTDRKKKLHEKAVHSVISKNMNRCGCCNQTFKSYLSKQKHLVEAHGVPELKIKCQACEKVFTSRRMFTVHMKRDHLLERPHKCSQCDKSFSSSFTLSNHMLTHTGLKLFKCEVCKKSYGRKKTLREHMRIHNDDRRFKCEHCGQAFIQKCSLKGHLSSKHGLTL